MPSICLAIWKTSSPSGDTVVNSSFYASDFARQTTGFAMHLALLQAAFCLLGLSRLSFPLQGIVNFEPPGFSCAASPTCPFYHQVSGLHWLLSANSMPAPPKPNSCTSCTSDIHKQSEQNNHCHYILQTDGPARLELPRHPGIVGDPLRIISA